MIKADTAQLIYTSRRHGRYLWGRLCLWGCLETEGYYYYYYNYYYYSRNSPTLPYPSLHYPTLHCNTLQQQLLLLLQLYGGLELG